MVLVNIVVVMFTRGAIFYLKILFYYSSSEHYAGRVH